MALTSKWDINPMKFLPKVELAIIDKAVDIAEKIFDGVVQRTPVLTGRVRACWRLSDGSPNFVSIPFDNHSKSAPLSPPEKIKLSPTDKYPKLFICNGQPYSVKLEYGYSKKAPTGMVRVTLAGLK